MQLAWRFCFWQGLRREEVVQIRCGGIDLENRQMVVGDEEFIPKGKREDVIPLSEPAAEIAEEWRRTLPAFSASVQALSGR
jgi:integrase